MKRRAVRLTSVAADDLAQLIEHAVVTSGFDAALALDARIDAALASLATLSLRGRVVPELNARGIAAFREIIRGTYRVIYRVDVANVWVLAVVDGRRDLAALLRERARR